ncbi:MAG: hypothetical protein ACLPOA_13825, partial [Methylocella sp.]
NATAFLTANRTNGLSKYLYAANKFLLTDCVIFEHITTFLLFHFTLLGQCCGALSILNPKAVSASCLMV